MLKRWFDVIVAAGALIVFSPLMAVCAVTIYLTEGRPILFCQTRVGKGCKAFTMVKFRTMSVVHNCDGVSDMGSDKRITTVGRVLRQTKLDELPQLWHVLWGEMSLVGPRPELLYWMDIYPHPDIWQRVYSVRPGITSMASLVYRHEHDILSQQQNPQHYYATVILPEKLSLDVQYAQRHNLWYDVGVIYKTVRAVLGKQYTNRDTV